MALLTRRIKLALAGGCLLAALVYAQKPFAQNSLLPLLWSLLALVPLVWLRRSWLRWAWGIPVLALGVLVVDAFFYRHRLAVEWRTWAPMFDIEDLKPGEMSPSGRTTVYLVHAGFTDSWFGIYVSAGELFPIQVDLESDSDHAAMNDLTMEWNGSFFTAGVGSLSFAYSETDQRAWTYQDWRQGGVSLTDPPRTLEAFSAMLTAMRDAVKVPAEAGQRAGP